LRWGSLEAEKSYRRFIAALTEDRVLSIRTGGGEDVFVSELADAFLDSTEFQMDKTEYMHFKYAISYLVELYGELDRTVQFKMDFFEGWLQEQSDRDRAIILDLATGETTGAVARKYGVSDGLISQYRKRYRSSWNEYIADKKETAENAA
jgi:hypothetical protein